MHNELSTAYAPSKTLQAALSHQQQQQPQATEQPQLDAAATSSPSKSVEQKREEQEEQDAMHLRGGCCVGCECCGLRCSVPCTIM
ncbi:hypothetical protein JCM6882_000310 [Rhodosporidiobolus microsporus]